MVDDDEARSPDEEVAPVTTQVLREIVDAYFTLFYFFGSHMRKGRCSEASACLR
jgi:hypothetical protein